MLTPSSLQEMLAQAERQDSLLTIEIERLTRKLWETRGQIAMLRSLIGQGATLQEPPPPLPNEGDQS